MLSLFLHSAIYKEIYQETIHFQRKSSSIKGKKRKGNCFWNFYKISEMSADHLQFLCNKFITDYDEAVKEFSDFPLRRYFRDSSDVLRGKTISSSTRIVMKNSLYELKFALAECVILAGKERERLTQNKKSLLGAHYVRKKWILYWMKRKLIPMKEDLQKFLKEGDIERPLSLSLVRVRQPWDFPSFNPNLIHGFDDHFQKIEGLLLEPPVTDDISVIGIVGMGGSGKTTLAQMVFHSRHVQKNFSLVIWVDLPQSLMKPHFPQFIVFAILKCLASDFSWCGSAYDLNELLHNLHCHLLNKKYLIVLDNVWHASDWYFDLDSKLQMEGNDNYTRLSHGLPRGSGGAIIVTSRLKEVACKMVSEQNLHPLEPTLDKESCWSIIEDSIKKKDSSIKKKDLYDRILPKMKDDMVDRCSGLPLAAKTLAEIISTKFLSDESAIKMFHLTFDKPIAPTSEVLKELRTYPGVYYANIASDDREVEGGGSCDPNEITRKLKEKYHVEISLNIDDN